MTIRPRAVKVLGSWLFCLAVLLLSVLSAYALDVPALKDRVNDYAHLLSPATVSQLDNALKYFEQQESTQIVVLTVPTLAGDSLEDFSIRVAEKWKIGQKGLDNGAILLIAKQERKLRIEVGYGLEGKLTDLTSGRIIRDVILPWFKQGNFDQGVLDGVGAMMSAVKGEFSAKTVQRPAGNKANNLIGMIAPLAIFFGFLGVILNKKGVAAGMAGAVGTPLLGTFLLGFSWAALIVFVIIGFFGGFAASSMQMSGGRRGGGGGFFLGPGGGFGGGGFGGGFGGFSGGGGGFGGGGASGGW
jgi:uncharacterized protein